MSLEFLSHLAEMGATNIHPAGRQATERLIAALDLRAGDRALEIGCGTGETMARILCQRAVSVEGLDVLPEMLRVARLRLRLTGCAGRAKLHLGQIGTPLPVPDAAYDRVYTESVLGFQDASIACALLAEIHRVLKPGGLYAANEAVWKRGTPEETVQAVNAACLRDFGLRAASECAWSVDDWLRLMHEAGFRVLSADSLDERTQNAAQCRAAPSSLGLTLSHALTLGYKVRARFVPRLMRQRARYRRLVAQPRAEGPHQEARLFVLQKE